LNPPHTSSALNIEHGLSTSVSKGGLAAPPLSSAVDDFPPATDSPVPRVTGISAARGFTLSPAIEEALSQFAPLPLAELKSYSLLNRTDTKYVLSEQQALEIFTEIRPHYRVLEVQGLRSGHYFTQYYDTPDLRMYHDHHNGDRERYKVRTRTYLDSGDCFLEIKCKNNRERTEKSRLIVPVGSGLTGPSADFVRQHTPYKPDQLINSTSNEFLRVTMVGVHDLERLTIDFGFSFQWRGLRGMLPGLVIAEVKQPRFTMQSIFVRQLHVRHIESTGFSKYCMALVVLDNQIRYNHFKPLLFRLQRLLRDYTENPSAHQVSGPIGPQLADTGQTATDADSSPWFPSFPAPKQAPHPAPFGAETR